MPGSINMRLSREDKNMFHRAGKVNSLLDLLRFQQTQGWAVRLGTRVGVLGR